MAVICTIMAFVCPAWALDFKIYKCIHKSAKFLSPDLHSFPEGHAAFKKEENVQLLFDPRFGQVLMDAPDEIRSRYEKSGHLLPYQNIPKDEIQQSKFIIFVEDGDMIFYSDGSVYVDHDVYTIGPSKITALKNEAENNIAGYIKDKLDQSQGAVYDGGGGHMSMYVKIGRDIRYVFNYKNVLPDLGPILEELQIKRRNRAKKYQEVISELDQIYTRRKYTHLLSTFKSQQGDKALFSRLCINKLLLRKLAVALFHTDSERIRAVSLFNKKFPETNWMLYYIALNKEPDLNLRLRYLEYVLQNHTDADYHADALILAAELYEEKGDFRSVKKCLEKRINEYFFQNAAGFRELICKEWIREAELQRPTKAIREYYPDDPIGRLHPFTPRSKAEDIGMPDDPIPFLKRRVEICIPMIPDHIKSRNLMHRWLSTPDESGVIKYFSNKYWYPSEPDHRTGFESDTIARVIVPESIEPGLHFVRTCVLSPSDLLTYPRGPDLGLDINGEPDDAGGFYNSLWRERMGTISIVRLKLHEDRAGRNKQPSDGKYKPMPMWVVDTPTTHVSFSSDGIHLATAFEQTVQIRDARTGKLLRSFPGHKYGIHTIDYSPNGKVLAIASVGGVHLRDPLTGKLIRTLGTDEWILPAAFSPDGKMLATGNKSGQAKLWDPESGQTIRTLDMGHESTWVIWVCFSPDGQTLATVTNFKPETMLWDVRTGRLRSTLQGYLENTLSVVDFSSTGKIMVSGSSHYPFPVIFWEQESGKILKTFEGHKGRIYDVAFSADNKFVATASGDGTTHIWDFTTGRILLTIEGDGPLAFSPKGDLLAIAQWKHVAVWDIRSIRD